MIVTENLSETFFLYCDTASYRFSRDSLLLARFARAKKGERAADFCSGTGVVGYDFFLREKEKIEALAFVEIDGEAAALCEKTAKENGVKDRVYVYAESVQAHAAAHKGEYTLVLCNPPYYKKGSGKGNMSLAARRAKTEETVDLPALADAFQAALKPLGRVCLIHRAERLAEVIFALKTRGLEPKRLQFVGEKNGKAPTLFLMEAVKGGKEGLTVLPALTDGETEERNGKK